MKDRQKKTHLLPSHTHEQLSMSTGRYPSPTLQAGGGPVAPFDHLAISSSPPGPLNDYVIGESAVIVVNPEGSTLGSDPPLQSIQLPVVSIMSHESINVALPPSEESTPPSATRIKSRKQSQIQRQQRSGDESPLGSLRRSTIILKQEIIRGPMYHILVVDDSSMTRKMLMKTLCSRGEYSVIITHPLNIPEQTFSTHTYAHTLLQHTF